jgi:hypothetical protein
VAKALLLAAVLACFYASAALADNPTVRITKDDQSRAVSALLKLSDFGAGWTGGQKKPSPLTSPSCPGFDPKESDLTVTGHADASFAYPRGDVVFNQDTQVLESSQAVQTDFSRTVQSGLAGCLAYQLKASGKGEVKSVNVKKLAFPKEGTDTAAYRANVTLHTAGHDVNVVTDYVFVGVGRLEYSLFITAPASEQGQLAAFEQAMVKILVKRADATGAGNVA